MRKVLLFFVLFFASKGNLLAQCTGSNHLWTVTTAQIEAANPHADAIDACLEGNASLENGDTVFIDYAGTVDIPYGMGFNTLSGTPKAITLKGRPCTMANTGDSYINISVPTSCPTKLNRSTTGHTMLQITLVSGLITYVHDLEFTDTSGESSKPCIEFIGQDDGATQDGRQYRYYNNRMVKCHAFTVWSYSAWGAGYNSYFDLTGQAFAFYAYQPTGYDFSDARWHADPGWGAAASATNGWNVWEQNLAESTDGTGHLFTDAYAGGKLQIRFNDFKDCIHVEGHGTEGGGRARGTRAFEVYMNHGITCPTGSSELHTIFARSGSIRTWGNKWDDFYSTAAQYVLNYQTLASVPFGTADGMDSPFHIHDPSNPQTTAIGCAGNTTCTVTTATVRTGDNTETVSASAGTFGSNDLVNSVIHKVGCSNTQLCGLLITANTSTQITYYNINADPPSGQHVIFPVGSQFTITKESYVMDAPCRGQGSLFPNSHYVNQTITWAANVATLTSSVGTMAALDIHVGDWIMIRDELRSGTIGSAWNSGTAYTADIQTVTYTNGHTYTAVASGTNHQPDISPAYWYDNGAGTTVSGAYNGIYQVTSINSPGATNLTFAYPYYDPGYSANAFDFFKKPDAFNDQVNEGCYQFLNTHNGSNMGSSLGGYGPFLYSDRDYFDYGGTPQTSSTSPFNGTTGVGVGIASRKPTTCTLGVGYWALDEGSWNNSSITYTVGGTPYSNGQFYKCTATNTWTLDYTPATFPLVVPSSCTPDHVAFISQPSSAQVNATLGTVSVGVYDASNNLCTGDTSSVTLSKNGSSTWGTLSSSTSLTKSASSGIATWTDLSIDSVGTGPIDAGDGMLSTAASNSVTISSQTPSSNGSIRWNIRIR